MLLGVADELVDLLRRGVLEGHCLCERPGLHVVLSGTEASPRSGEAADSRRGAHDLSRIPRIVASSSRTLMGLPWKPSKPAAMIFWRSWAMTDAVTAMTGIARVVGSARSSLSASIVWYPWTWRVSRTSFRFLGLSSTIRISSFAMADRQGERERRPFS